MKTQYLIDTQTWLWWHISPDMLSSEQIEIIENGDNIIHFSVVSAWEINLKYRLERLRLPSLPSIYIPQRLNKSRMQVLALELEHSLSVEQLPPYHNDPFDRFLIKQAQINELTILTNDRRFKSYDVGLVL